jgi:PAS domain S-box-containing protein
MSIPIPQPRLGAPTSSLNSLRWLVSICLLCLTMVFGLRWYFDSLETEIKQRDDNERARLFVGEEIVRSIRDIEKDFYRLTVTQNAAGFARINDIINGQLDKIRHDLNVLRSGGTSRRVMQTNIDGHDELTREATYLPNQGNPTMVMELIEIEPQLGQISTRASKLLQLLTRRWQAVEAANARAFLAAEEDLVVALKQIPPQFERLNENANRLFLEGDQRLQALESELRAQATRLKQIETGLLSLVVIIGAILAFLFMRRLTEALRETRRARDDTESQREQNATILDTLGDGVYTTDLEGAVTYVNAAGERILGWRSADLVGLPSHNAIHHTRPDGALFPRDECPLMAVLKQGITLDGEDHFVHSDGHHVPVSYRSKPLYLNGEVVGSLVSFQDITERRQTRTRLKLIESAIEETAQGIHIMNAEIHAQGPLIQYVNAGFCQITGYSAEEAVGAHAAALYGPQADRSKLKQIETAITQGESVTLEFNGHRKDGSSYAAELHLSPVHAESGEVSHYIGLVSDIGLRKQAEAALRDARDQALENSRLKSEFLSTMSHEIRTPMNGIIGMTDLLLDTPLDTEQREFTGIVRDSAQALLVIINDILDFSKIEAGKLDIEITEFSASQVVEGTVELLMARAREKSLSLNSFVDPALPDRLMGDPTRLRQVLLNIIANGIKFTEFGTIEVSAMCVNVGTDPMLRFEISDTGIGIDEATQARLFKSFTQADSSTTRKYGGTGLGLAICKRLVELMGGRIGIDSQPGQGSTFWFTLPLIPGAAIPNSPVLAPLIATGTQALRVLVVDDQATDRKILHRYLSSWDIASDGASNAQEAIKLLEDALAVGAPYSVAIIDYVMPGMDGLSLVSHMRSDPRFKPMRLILLTAHDQRELSANALEAGASAFLAKPVRQSQLYESLIDSDWQLESSLASPPCNAPSPDMKSSFDKRRLILLAEDNLINQRVAQLQIARLGYAMDVVGNGQLAVDAVARSSDPHGSAYAAVLMDCQMPVLDGFEATAAIRRAESVGERIPIIAMTANAMQGDRERCLTAGMDDYISKPINPEQLQAVLARWAGPALVSDESPNAAPPIVTAPDAEPDRPGMQAINFALLDDYFGDDPETITKLLDLFLSTSLTLMAKLGDAITQRNAAVVLAIAHEIKGSCGNIGIDQMAHVAARLETLAPSLDWPVMESSYQQLVDALNEVVAAIALR